MLKFRLVSSDVLILGGGCAGLKAAIKAAETGVDTLVITNLAAGIGGSSFYCKSPPWGINYASDDDQDKQMFLNETLNIAGGCIDSQLAEILVDQSPECFRELVGYGAQFIQAKEIQLIACFGENTRGAILIDTKQGSASLISAARKAGVRFLDRLQVVDLVLQDDECNGAIAVDENGDYIFLQSCSVILATGGAEGLWRYSFSNGDTLGSSYAMSARYGAELVNLEFIQFIPGTVYPQKGLNFFHSTLSMSPKIYNRNSELFLDKYLPHEFSSEQCLKKRSMHGPFCAENESRYFDFALLGENSFDDTYDVYGGRLEFLTDFSKKPEYRFWAKLLTEKGFDPCGNGLRIFPYCQAFNGGVVINGKSETQINGVFACGEAAGGYHGANRLGGNSILATQVFGKIAGQSAAKRAIGHRKRYMTDDQLQESLFDSFQGTADTCSPKLILGSLQETMQQAAFLKRDEISLLRALTRVRRMEKEFNPFACTEKNQIAHAFTVKNALLASELILHAMLERRETKGGHFRSDYLNQNKNGRMQRIKL